ncbi:hypothetical protein ACVBR5_000948 [Burkholderia cenocepacia]
MKARKCEIAVLAALSLGRRRMTAAELVQETGYARRSVQLALRRLRDMERVYICRLAPPDDFARDKPAPVYKLGKGKDAVYRATSNATRCARYQAKRRRNSVAPFALGDVWQNVASA